MKQRVIIPTALAAFTLTAAIVYSVSADTISEALIPVERTYDFDLADTIVTRTDRTEGRPALTYLFNFSTQVVVSNNGRWTFEDAGKAGVADMAQIRHLACEEAAKSTRFEAFALQYCG